MHWAGANPDSKVAAQGPLPGRSNYLIGNDPSRWLHSIPQFSRVEYRGVYPGIDLAFYGNQNRLEYDFEVAPGADPSRIELEFAGASDVSLAKNGDMLLAAGGRELRFHAPHIYQKTQTGQQAVAGSFRLLGKARAGFEVGPYDRARELVIDPVLTFSTYLGGAGDESCTTITGAAAGFVPHCPSIAIDSGGRIYVAGATTSLTGTVEGVTPNINNTKANAAAYVFVSQIATSSAGAVLNYITYIGGGSGPGGAAAIQYPAGVGVDNGFNVYVAGTTNASDYPTTPSAFQATAATPGNHAFVSKLDSSGSANLYSTYLAGNGVDNASNMALDTQGRVYVIGTTTSSNFPVTLGAIQPTANASNQFFFSKINTALNTVNSLQYSTYIGGSTPAGGVVVGGAVAVDSAFNVYLAGGTNFSDMGSGSTNPWILNAYQSALKGGLDVWAAKLNAPASNTQQYTLAYGTYLGSSGDDVAYGIATDGSSTYITGSTTSTDITIPSTTQAFQTCLDQAPPNTSPCPTGVTASDAFVAKFGGQAVTGTTLGNVVLDYFSYLGGSLQDVGLDVVADSAQNARVTGFTASSDFPNQGAFQSTSGGGTDAFVARLNTGTSTSTNTSTSSYLGGAGTDIATSIALDATLNTYVAGETSSPTGSFPTCPTSTDCGPNSIPPIANGGAGLSGLTDAFVAELGSNASGLSMPAITPANAPNPTANPSPVGVGGTVTFTYNIYNSGDPVAGVVFNDQLGSLTGSATTSVGSCGNAGSGVITCTLGVVPTSVTSTTSGESSAAQVKVTVNAPGGSVPLGSGSVGNSAFLSFPGGTLPSISASVPLNDFSVSASSASATTIPSGGQVNYSITVSPTSSGFSESVTLACGAGLPAGSTCSFSNSSIPNMNNGPQSRTLSISTMARVTTTTGLFRRGVTYALWLPVLGFGLIGFGDPRRRRVLLILPFTILLAAAGLLIGCSYSSHTTTTTGTPAGTYTVPVNATSGTATRTTTVQFTVE
jgi:hypothetical protein